ncbi:carbohydrate ABC transporter permease [Ktedonosporobacter rubrisoli]|nr:carbohydrate ABC transporter permease [Ktedonosporobacter rubrisoli]
MDSSKQATLPDKKAWPAGLAHPARQAMSLQRRILLYAQWLALLVFLLWTLFPLYWLISTSLKENNEILTSPPSLFPRHLSLAGYQYFFANFTAFLFNSVVVTLGSTLIALVVGTLAAYSLSRFRFPKFIFGLVWILILIIRMTIPVAFIIPLYQILKGLGLYNTLLGLIIAYTLTSLPFVIWLMVSFFSEVPQEIDEMGLVDGGSYLKVFSRIVLPLVAPGLAASAIMAMLFTWNDLLFGLFLTANEQAMTLPVSIVSFITQYATLWSQLASGGVVAIVPMVILIMFIQRYLVHGLTAGAIK